MRRRRTWRYRRRPGEALAFASLAVLAALAALVVAAELAAEAAGWAWQETRLLAVPLVTAAVRYGPAAGLALAAAAVLLLAGRAWLRRRRHAAFTRGARLVTILARPRSARTAPWRCGGT
jgi:hypothetical protein